uniref:PET117 polypeptide n=1 Tax=Ditylenchus dipsaci TaxID=166011 RepID=A0A915DLX8_9BILA
MTTAKRQYGMLAFIAACAFTTCAIGFVFYDEKTQRIRRQEGVKLRLQQQKQNMEEYEQQKMLFEKAKQK